MGNGAAREPERLAMLPGTDHNVVGSTNDQYFDLMASLLGVAQAGSRFQSPLRVLSWLLHQKEVHEQEQETKYTKGTLQLLDQRKLR